MNNILRNKMCFFLLIILVGLNACSSESSEKVVLEGNVKGSKERIMAKTKLKLDYKNSKVSYYGTTNVSEEQILIETKLIDIADRRFETKWQNKDAKGISEEYTIEGSVFMKPGVKPRLGRDAIEQEFAKSVQGVDRVKFFQDELAFYGDLTVAFQRCHMLGYVNTQDDHIFEGSYVILWKKVNGEWLIEYDMFNADK